MMCYATESLRLKLDYSCVVMTVLAREHNMAVLPPCCSISISPLAILPVGDLLHPPPGQERYEATIFWRSQWARLLESIPSLSLGLARIHGYLRG